MTRDQLERFVLVLAPMAPHMSEELWHKLGHERSLAYQAFPTPDPKMLVDDSVEVPVSVNGKVRGKITVAAGLDKAALEREAMASELVRALTAGKPVNKVIVVPGKMVNLVMS